MGMAGCRHGLAPDANCPRCKQDTIDALHAEVMRLRTALQHLYTKVLQFGSDTYHELYRIELAEARAALRPEEP